MCLKRLPEVFPHSVKKIVNHHALRVGILDNHGCGIRDDNLLARDRPRKGNLRSLFPCFLTFCSHLLVMLVDILLLFLRKLEFPGRVLQGPLVIDNPLNHCIEFDHRADPLGRIHVRRQPVDRAQDVSKYLRVRHRTCGIVLGLGCRLLGLDLFRSGLFCDLLRLIRFTGKQSKRANT